MYEFCKTAAYDIGNLIPNLRLRFLCSQNVYSRDKDIFSPGSRVRIFFRGCVFQSAPYARSTDTFVFFLSSGGYDGATFLNIVEIYDPAKDQWIQGVPMTSGRSGHASAVSYYQCPMHCDHLDHNIALERPPS